MDDDPKSTVRTKYSLLRLAGVALAWIGVQMIWSCEYAATTPFFQSNLHMDPQKAQGIWIAGPITGLFVQPVIGALSDKCTSRLGRRRPFIIGGMIAVIAGSVLFSNCEKIAGKGTTGATVIAICAFWMMDLSINTVQGPLRALLSDMATESQQGTVQTFASFFQGLGAILGFFFYSSFEEPSAHIQIIFLVAYSTLAVTGVVTLACSVERRRLPRPDEVRMGVVETAVRPFKDTALGIATMPNAMIRVAIVQVFTWFAWFCLNTIMTSWWGHDIYHGDSESDNSDLKKRFAEGNKHGGLAGSLQAAVQLVASFALPPIIKRVGIKPSYIACLVTAFGCFVGAFLSHSPASPPPQRVLDGAYASVSLSGIGLAATNVFPFTLVGLIFTDESKKGLNMGVLNVFIVIPQLIDTLYTGTVTEKFGGERWVILIGAGWWVCAIISAFFLKIPARQKNSLLDPLAASDSLGEEEAEGGLKA